MRKLILALGLLVSTVAFANPGSPYLSFGWVPASGSSAPSADGSLVTGHCPNSGSTVTCATSTGMSTTNATDTILCAVNIGGVGALSGVSVSGGSLTWTADGASTATAQYSAIFWARSSGTISSATITASWTGANEAQIACQAYSGALDPTGKTPGTDYAVGGRTSTTHTTTPSVTVTTIGATNSLLFASGHCWGQTGDITADVNSTIIDQYRAGSGEPDNWFEQSTSPVSAGSHAIGGTVPVSQSCMMRVMELPHS